MTKVKQFAIHGQAVACQFGGGGRDDDLTSVGGMCQPGSNMEDGPKDVSVVDLHLPGMHSHRNRQHLDTVPLFPHDRQLEVESGGDCIGGLVKY